MSIELEELEICNWDQATHTYDPRGKLIELRRTSSSQDIFDVYIDNKRTYAYHLLTFKDLGFVPYRKKELKTYTFFEAIQEPGLYIEKFSRLLNTQFRVNDNLHVNFLGSPSPKLVSFMSQSFIKIKENRPSTDLPWASDLADQLVSGTKLINDINSVHTFIYIYDGWAVLEDEKGVLHREEKRRLARYYDWEGKPKKFREW
jgi:hypothetical protein